MFFLFAFVFGACIGSFLNVLVYRLPAGMSLVRPASHCPKCGHPIRPYDNVPVLGWLFLGGRCRDCKEPISIRYPIVELLTAILFLTVAVAEGNAPGPGTFGPIFPPEPRMEASEASAVRLPRSELEVAGRFFYHVFLVSGLWAAFLMQLDDKRIPWRFFLVLLLGGFLPSILWSWLHPIPTLPDLQLGPFAGLIDVTAGAVPGLLLFAVIRLFLKDRPMLIEGAWGLLVAGVFLGMHAAAILAAFLLLDALLLVARRSPVKPLLLLPTGWLLAGALALLFWPPV